MSDIDGYHAFLATKQRVVHDAGRLVELDDIHPSLFGFQRAITAWAVRKGRAAMWCDTGLGKTRMQVEWARLTGQRTLILAPLGVTAQTVAEAAKIGVEVVYAHRQAEASDGITITNYERLHLFDPESFGAVVLDESSILKAFSGTTKKLLVRSFADTPWRLACTATPAPNDLEELCNHADFLGLDETVGDALHLLHRRQPGQLHALPAETPRPRRLLPLARLLGDGRPVALRPRIPRRQLPAASPHHPSPFRRHRLAARRPAVRHRTPRRRRSVRRAPRHPRRPGRAGS